MEPIIVCRGIAKSYYRGALEIPVLQGLDREARLLVVPPDLKLEPGARVRAR